MKVKMRAHSDNFRVNEMKRIFKCGRRFVITEVVLNKQNNFLVEDMTEENNCTAFLGVSFNMRGAMRMIDKECRRRAFERNRRLSKKFKLDYK